jgi:hypothetical protein
MADKAGYRLRLQTETSIALRATDSFSKEVRTTAETRSERLEDREGKEEGKDVEEQKNNGSWKLQCSGSVITAVSRSARTKWTEQAC